MSELKAYRFLGQDEVWLDANLGSDYYLKSEADKVIAELNKKIKLYEDLGPCKEGCPALRHSQRRVESEIYKVKLNEKEIRHHKYKRCLDKAKWCKDKMQHYKYDDKVILYGFRFYEKWYHRWLKIAEKFKEVK